jgi:hypothetical protein
MTATVHRFLKCHCGYPTLHPLSALLEPFADPDALPNDVHAIGVVCPYCRQIDIHFLEEGKGGPARLDRAVLQEPDENMEAVYESVARCEEPTCRFLLPIMLQVSRDMTDADYSKWRTASRFEGLVCPDGHLTMKPIDWT